MTNEETVLGLLRKGVSELAFHSRFYVAISKPGCGNRVLIK